MSFSEFIQWLSKLFSKKTESTSQTTSPPASTEATSPITPPVVPAEPVIPKLIAIQTDTDKVTLSQTVEFKLITEPAGDYAACTIDLSDTNGCKLISDINPDTGIFTIRFDKASKSANDIQNIKATHPEGDQVKTVTVSQMKLFWHNHSGRKNICDETLFANQCAIRMGAALELSDIKLPLDRRILRRCTTEYRAFADHSQGKVKGHVLAAQELANWMKSEPSIFGSREVVHSKDEIVGRSGLIFFKDGWGTTDHIDVWDGESLVGGFPSYFESEFKELWFWDLY